MVQIQIIPCDYQNRNELIAIIKNVIKQHSLKDSVTSAVREQLLNTPVYVEISDYLIDMGPSVRLRFDPMMYQDKQEREKVLYHEFTHIIDRLDPNFGINCQNEDEARNIQPSAMTNSDFFLYKSIWNCYIDGTLEQFKQNPRSLQQHLQEFYDNTKRLGGHFAPEVNEILKSAWKNKNLTFNEIVSLTQECLQYWQSKENKET